MQTKYAYVACIQSFGLTEAITEVVRSDEEKLRRFWPLLTFFTYRIPKNF